MHVNTIIEARFAIFSEDVFPYNMQSESSSLKMLHDIASSNIQEVIDEHSIYNVVKGHEPQ